ncbi:MAG: hypothetical protein NTX03_04090 [Bacteroidetes bacterium]|nr:hypothetical protein [Bacteroidota bacterium]
MLKKSIYFFVINLILSLSYLNTQAQKSKWEWVKSASYNIIPTATTTDGNGNIIAAGGYRSTKVKFDTFHVSSYGQENIFIVKYNANGKVKWAKTNEYGGSDRDNKVLAVATDDSGNVYVTGYFGSAWLKLDTFIRKKNSPTATWADVFIAKYDSNGNALWVNVIREEMYWLPEYLGVIPLRLILINSLTAILVKLTRIFF